MRRQTLTLFTTILILLSCKTDMQKENSEIVKSFEYKDNHLTVTRTISRIMPDTYNVVIKIASTEQLEGYVTIEDKFENSTICVDNAKWKFAPYVSSDKEIRFVFSDPNKTEGPATPIPSFKDFKVDYIVKVKDNKNLKIKGTIMYLEKHGKNLVPVPELMTPADF